MDEVKGSDTMAIGDRIKMLRGKDHLDLSQTEFAARLGLGRGTIKGIEEGRTEATPLLLEHICTIYHVNPEWLESGTGDMFVEISPDEEMMRDFGRLFTKDAPETAKIKKRLIRALLKLDDQQLENAVSFAKILLSDEDEE